MRPLIAVFGPLALVVALAGCGRPTADWTYTAFDNFDPSQVAMLPSNTYDSAAVARSDSTTPQAQAPAAIVAR